MSKDIAVVIIHARRAAIALHRFGQHALAASDEAVERGEKLMSEASPGLTTLALAAADRHHARTKGRTASVVAPSTSPFFIPHNTTSEEQNRFDVQNGRRSGMRGHLCKVLTPDRGSLKNVGAEKRTRDTRRTGLKVQMYAASYATRIGWTN